MINQLLKYSTSGLFVLAAYGILAQPSSQLGSFDLVPQSIYSNPALRPQAKLNIAVPALGNINARHGNNFLRINEHLASDGNGTATLQTEKLLKEIDQLAVMEQGLDLELFHIGLRIDKHYFHARASERTQLGVYLPKDLFYLTAYGNAGTHQFEDNTADLSGFGIDAIHFREYALGYNYALNEKWTFGLTAKYLYGMERIQTGSSSLKLYTDPQTYELKTSGSLRLNTSGIYGLIDTDARAVQSDIGQYLLGLSNRGFAADLGLVYKPVDKLQVALSANDIGFINWKSDVATYGSQDASFAFDGIDLTDFLFAEGQGFNESFDNELDSLVADLQNTYNFQRSSESFSTGVNGHFRYAVSYDLYENENFSGKTWANISHGIGQSRVPFALAIGYNQKCWNVIEVGVHYSKTKYYQSSLGAGLSANAGPVQLYAMVENFRFANLSRLNIIDEDNSNQITSVVYFQNPNDLRLNVGMNLTFGIRADTNPGGRPMTR